MFDGQMNIGAHPKADRLEYASVFFFWAIMDLKIVDISTCECFRLGPGVPYLSKV